MDKPVSVCFCDACAGYAVANDETLDTKLRNLRAQLEWFAKRVTETFFQPLKVFIPSLVFADEDVLRAAN
jgi:hypothetical protein